MRLELLGGGKVCKSPPGFSLLPAEGDRPAWSVQLEIPGLGGLKKRGVADLLAGEDGIAFQWQAGLGNAIEPRLLQNCACASRR